MYMYASMAKASSIRNLTSRSTKAACIDSCHFNYTGCKSIKSYCIYSILLVASSYVASFVILKTLIAILVAVAF